MSNQQQKKQHREQSHKNSPLEDGYSSLSDSSLVNLIMSSILTIVMAASVANCNLNNLYFAHCWLNHTILKVVANDTFRQVKTHAAANGRKIIDRTGYAWLQNKTAVGRYIEMKICMEAFTVPSYVLPPPQIH
jgi:hypothetical protein